MNPEIGSFDAKIELPGLLREVQAAIDAMKAFPKIKGVPEEDIQSWIAARPDGPSQQRRGPPRPPSAASR
jgi:hypothetical protein